MNNLPNEIIFCISNYCNIIEFLNKKNYYYFKNLRENLINSIVKKPLTISYILIEWHEYLFHINSIPTQYKKSSNKLILNDKNMIKNICEIKSMLITKNMNNRKFSGKSGQVFVIYYSIEDFKSDDERYKMYLSLIYK